MTTRTDAIADLRHRFARDGYPRLTMLVILTLAGAVAFLVSVAVLRLGVTAMGPRYGLAVLVGYAAFLVLIRGWIGFHRGEWGFGSRGFDAVDVADGFSAAIDPRSTRTGAGAVAVGTLDPAPALERQRRRDDSSALGRAVDGATSAVDLDELWWVVIAIVAALGGVLCVFYVVYAAPLLLAEVAIDAALVSAVYRRLRQEDVGHWTGAVVRHTWMPTLALFLCMSVAGFALQRIVPSAHSIGGVIRAFVE